MNILTCVHNNGIVNQYQIVEDLDDQENKTQIQVIWNGEVHCTVVGLNSFPVQHSSTANRWLIKNYRAIYLNGILIAKDGKVYPTKKRWWQFWR